MRPPEATAKSWADPQHESLTPLWWLAEFFPKWVWEKGRGRRPRLGMGRRRFVPPGACIHRSALLRIRETVYRPGNLSTVFLDLVRDLAEVPEVLAYESGDAPAGDRS